MSVNKDLLILNSRGIFKDIFLLLIKFLVGKVLCEKEVNSSIKVRCFLILLKEHYAFGSIRIYSKIEPWAKG